MERLGRYELIEYIAEDPPWRLFRARRVDDGGPYRARDGDVVFRLLTAVPADAAGQARLARARIAVELDHPHLENVIEWEHDDPNCVTELVRGWRLHHLIDRDAPLALAAICRVARQLCQALDYLHRHSASDRPAPARGVVHRAVRPHNVLITTSGDAQLKNPGLEMVRGREPALLSTARPAVYERLSPEQCRGELPDHRSDIFQLGLLLRELITGRSVFSQGSPFDTVAALRSQSAPPLDPRAADIPEALVQIISHSLAKSPDRRPQSVQELASDLAAVEAEAGWRDGREQLLEQLHLKGLRGQPRVGGFL